MEYRMLLMIRTNESGQRQLNPSMLLKKRKSQDFLDTNINLPLQQEPMIQQ